MTIDPRTIDPGTIDPVTNGTQTNNILRRYYGSSLAACRDANYVTPTQPYVTPGQCGWTNDITYYSDTQGPNDDARFYTGRGRNATLSWQASF